MPRGGDGRRRVLMTSSARFSATAFTASATRPDATQTLSLSLSLSVPSDPPPSIDLFHLCFVRTVSQPRHVVFSASLFSALRPCSGATTTLPFREASTSWLGCPLALRVTSISSQIRP